MKKLFTPTGISRMVVLLFLSVSATTSFAVARTWIGVGAGGAGTDFNASANWSPAGAPGAADDLTINMNANGTITLSSSVTINTISFNVTGSNVVGVLDVGTSMLTINSTSGFSATSGNTNTRGILHMGTNPAGVTFNGDATFNSAGTALFKFRAAVTNPGSCIFMANLTTGANAFTEPGDEPQFIFNKAGAQSWTFNSTTNYIVPESIIVGTTNTPTVSFTGAGTNFLLNVYNGNLTVRANATLDIGKFYCDKLNGTGTITLNANSTLRIGSTTDFPTGFSTYAIDATSTVEFYGTATTQDVGAMPGVDNYGNLILSGGGSKQQTSVGGIRVRGNMTIASGTTYYAWAELTTVDGTCTNNGTYNASTNIQTFNGNLVNNGTWTQPAGASSIAQFTGTVAQTFSGTTTTTAFQRMTMNNTSSTGLTLATPATVVTALTLTDGVVYTDNTNLLILNDNCTSTTGSNASHVDGPMRKIGNDAFAFPVGDAGVWARIGISAPGNTAHHFTAQYIRTPYSSLTPVAATLEYVSQIEHWILDRTNGASNVTVTLYWESSTQSGINTFSNDLHVARWDGSMWQDHGSASMTGSVSAGTVSSSAAVTSFSPFTFASISGGPAVNPLPVELVYFRAKCEDNGVRLDWETASEQDNKKFILSRSADGNQYTDFAQVSGAGNSSVPVQYNFSDQMVYFTTFYRLSQEDGDGNITVFDPVVADCSNMSTYDYYIYTEGDEIFFVINSSEKSFASVELYDISGKMLNSRIVECESGINKYSIRKSDLSKGIYLVRLASGTYSYSQKIIVD